MVKIHDSSGMPEKQHTSEGSLLGLGLFKAKGRSILALAAGFLFAGNGMALYAQTYTDPLPDEPLPEPEPGVITSGPFSLEPILTTELSYDDNIFESETDETDSWITRLKPTLIGRLEADGQAYSLRYEGDYGTYEQSGDDDYDDHNFFADANLNLNFRNYVNLDAAYRMDHEDRGTGITEGINPVIFPAFDKPVKVDFTEFNGEYAYGVPEQTGRIVLAAGYRDRQYQNFRDQTRYQDRERPQASATFYYRVMPATSLLFEVKADKVQYDETRPGTASLDSDTQYYLAGATWDVTELTSGTVKLGWVDREYDDNTRGNFSEFDWEVDLRWSPLSYSHVDLVTSREPLEAYGNADFIDTKRYAATWTHGWTDDLESRLQVAYLDETFVGEDRNEETYDYGFSLNYQWRNWLALDLGANYSNRDSNIDALEFRRTVYRLGATLSLN